MTTGSWPLPHNGNADGTLQGLRVLDLCVAGPGPFATLILAGYGADVIHVSRAGKQDPTTESSHHNGGKRSICVDLKSPAGRDIVLKLAAAADVVLEGFRPGVVERLGIGPDVLMEANPRLVYVRMTGWGQSGPYANEPGHDINYIGVGGALSVIGIDQPIPPLALLGDFSSGSLTTIISILAALRQRDQTGVGGVLDCNIADGAAMLMHSMVSAKPRGSVPMRELLNGSTPFYRTYRCADGKWVSVGCIEPKFYANMIRLMGLGDDPVAVRQYDQKLWPELAKVLADRFLTKTREEWTELLALAETCVFPVVEPGELADNPHMAARRSAIRKDGRVHVARAGRFVGQPAVHFDEPCAMGTHTDAVLSEIGYDAGQIAQLHEEGVANGPFEG